MKTLITSDDGETFSSAVDAARHELTPERLSKLSDAMSKMSLSEKTNWCSSQACACMGCANDKVQELGFNEAHWQVWCEDVFPTLPISLNDENANYNVFIEKDAFDINTTIKAVRLVTGLGPMEAKFLVESNQPIKMDITYFDALSVQKTLEQYGIQSRREQYEHA